MLLRERSFTAVNYKIDINNNKYINKNSTQYFLFVTADVAVGGGVVVRIVFDVVIKKIRNGIKCHIRAAYTITHRTKGKMGKAKKTERESDRETAHEVCIS